MQVPCPNCGHVLNVPPDKAAVPNLKAKCRCGTVFPIASAARPDAALVSAVPAARTPASAKAAPAAADRVAEIRAANARATAAPVPAAASASASAGGAAATARAGVARAAAAMPPAVMMAAAAGQPLKPPPLPPRPSGVPQGAPMRTAAAVPRPAPPVAARPAAARPAAATPSATAAAPRPRTARVPWTRCQNHTDARSEHVCPKCGKGFCDPCTQKVQTAVICPSCEGLCVAHAAYEQTQQQARQRGRSMMEEIGVIARYPFGDALAFVMLALFTWFFGLFAGFAGIMVVLSKGVLTWYSFNAVSKVAIGNMRDVMPEFREVSDIANALRLSLAALAISAGPLFLCISLIPGASRLADRWAAQGPRMDVVHAQAAASPAPAGAAGDEDDEQPSGGAHEREDVFEAMREGSSLIAPLAMLGIVGAVAWMIAYMPVALTVAALSKSILSTLNPMIGIDTMKKMGSTYWQALAIYGVLIVGQWLLGAGLRFIPFVGGLAASFVDAYAALAVGCTLGLAVFKKAVELAWD